MTMLFIFFTSFSIAMYSPRVGWQNPAAARCDSRRSFSAVHRRSAGFQQFLFYGHLPGRMAVGQMDVALAKQVLAQGGGFIFLAVYAARRQNRHHVVDEILERGRTGGLNDVDAGTTALLGAGPPLHGDR